MATGTVSTIGQGVLTKSAARARTSRREHRYLFYPTGSTMTVKNGLYSIRIEMKDGVRGRATGVTRLYIAPKMLIVVLCERRKIARPSRPRSRSPAQRVVVLLSLRPLYAAAVSSVPLLFASSTTSSVTTVKRAKVAEPNVVEIATSAASRPRAMTIRPIRG